MMRRALVLLAVLASCKTSEKKAGTPAGPAVAASCDYVSKTAGDNHSCQEAYAEAQVDVLEKWCGELQGARDHGTFAKGTGCPVEGRDGGCLYPNGSVQWRYAGELSCIGGLEFKRHPKRKEATPYRCANSRLCTETQSVFDLSRTVEAANCEAGGSEYDAGTCSTENVIGRCKLHRRTDDAVWLFYGTVPLEEAKSTCAQVAGTFVEEKPAESAGASAGSASAGSAGGANVGSAK